MTMLRKLWRVSGEHEAEGCANLLQQLGIMRVAFLYDSSAWALVDTAHLRHLQVSLVLCNAVACHRHVVVCMLVVSSACPFLVCSKLCSCCKAVCLEG